MKRDTAPRARGVLLENPGTMASSKRLLVEEEEEEDYDGDGDDDGECFCVWMFGSSI